MKNSTKNTESLEVTANDVFQTLPVEDNMNTDLSTMDNTNMVANLGMADLFDAFEKNEVQSESLNSTYLNLDDEQGVEKVFVHIENSTIADTINDTDDRIPCVVLLNKEGERFICADKQLVSKLLNNPLPALVKIVYKGMLQSKTNKAYKYRDFDVRRAILKA